jgi:hypothetical protein
LDEKSSIDVPIRTPIRKTIDKKIRMIKSKANPFGTFFFCIQRKGGEVTIVMKAANRNGTTKDSAAFIPATIITKEARIINIRNELLLPGFVVSKKYPSLILIYLTFTSKGFSILN